MDTPTALLAVQGLVSLTFPVIGFFAVRSLKQIDKKLDGVDTKISDLGKTDTEIKVELAEIRVRVIHLERMMGLGK